MVLQQVLSQSISDIKELLVLREIPPHTLRPQLRGSRITKYAAEILTEILKASIGLDIRTPKGTPELCAMQAAVNFSMFISAAGSVRLVSQTFCASTSRSEMKSILCKP